MEIVGSRRELVEKIKSWGEAEEVQLLATEGNLLGHKCYIIVYKGLIGSDCECDYALPLDSIHNGSYYNTTKDILYGLPVCFFDIVGDDVPEYYPVLISNKSEQLPSAPLSDLHSIFNGLMRGSYEGEVFTESIEIPSLLDDLDTNSFIDCRCEGKLLVPTHLLCQLTGSGLDCSESDIDLKGTGGWGLDNIKIEETKEKGSENDIDLGNTGRWALDEDNSKGNHIVYKDFLRRGIDLNVYDNRLKIVNTSGSGKQELDFIDNFEWKKFYNSINEMLICLNLCHYKIALNSYVTKGLYDIFNEKFN